MHYWLMKSEPDAYSIHDLKRDGSTLWDGIRNYQARNFMRQMQIGDQAFFYHSNTQPPGIVGLMEVIETHLVDPSQFDRHSPYHDPRSTPERPRWDCVRLRYLRTFSQLLTLETLRNTFTAEELLVLRPANRLSIVPVADAVAGRLLQMLAQ